MKSSSKLAVAIVLFLGVAALQTLGQSGDFDSSSGDGSGAFSGSGSGDGGSGEWRCSRPVDLPRVNRTRNKLFDRLKFEMRCHVACIEKVRP